MRNISLFKFVKVVYENEGGSTTTQTTTTTPESGDPTKPEGGGAGDAKRTYNQEEVQKLVEAERKRAQDQTRTTIQNLEAIKASQQLSEQEKAKLASQIDELNKSLLSKEELAKRERDRLVNEHKSTLENVTKERDTWKTRFEESQIVRAITDAAVQGDAFNPKLIVPLLRPNAALVEVMDGDKPTGDFSVKLNITVEENGQIKNLTLTPAEAIKVMKDKPDEFGNLFKGNLNGGVGGNASPRNQNNIDMTTNDHAAYLKNRDVILGRTPRQSAKK